MKVVFLAFARDDLLALHDYIAAAAGPHIADDYLDRLETACLGLAHFPERGAPRDQLGVGIRILGFERRVTIVFRVAASEVQIIRILSAGRDVERAMDGL